MIECISDDRCADICTMYTNLVSASLMDNGLNVGDRTIDLDRCNHGADLVWARSTVVLITTRVYCYHLTIIIAVMHDRSRDYDRLA